jgi:hypothetical protein
MSVQIEVQIGAQGRCGLRSARAVPFSARVPGRGAGATVDAALPLAPVGAKGARASVDPNGLTLKRTTLAPAARMAAVKYETDFVFAW